MLTTGKVAVTENLNYEINSILDSRSILNRKEAKTILTLECLLKCQPNKDKAVEDRIIRLTTYFKNRLVKIRHELNELKLTQDTLKETVDAIEKYFIEDSFSMEAGPTHGSFQQQSHDSFNLTFRNKFQNHGMPASGPCISD